MSVLQSTYYENVPDLDRHGSLDYSDVQLTVHVAATSYEHVHICLERLDQEVEVNLTIENAEAILAGLSKAIESAKKGRAFLHG